MKKYIKLFPVVIFLLLILIPYTAAEEWEKVVDHGFGKHRNDYAWSMATFKNKIYVGTLNIETQAEIWCSDSGEKDTWQMVYKAWGSFNTGIRCLYADGDTALYASTTNVTGAAILRSTDGRTWKVVGSRGLGNRNNTSIRCMVRFKDYLYAGAGGKVAELYRSLDGSKWERVEDDPGFANTRVKNSSGRMVLNNIMIGELAVFNGYLYAFTWTKDLNSRRALFWMFTRLLPRNSAIQEIIRESDFPLLASYAEPIGGTSPYSDSEDATYAILPPSPGAFEVWRSADGTNWELVVGQNDPYGNGMGFSGLDPANIDNDAVTSIAVFQDKLYLGTEHDYAKTGIWRTEEGTVWEKVLDFPELGEKKNYYVWRMQPFKDRLFVGTQNMGAMIEGGVTGGQIWASYTGDVGSFDNLVHDGFDGETIFLTGGVRIPKNYGIRSFVILDDKLYAGTATIISMPLMGSVTTSKMVGCEVWRMR